MDKSKLQLYFIMGTPNIGDRDPLTVLEGALKGGITAFQLREKGEGALVGAELKELAAKCKALCDEYKVPFIINDDVDLALEIDADGVHIGQEDGVVSEVRSKIGPDKILGVSTHSVNEALTASDAGANYVGVGPLFETDSKENAGAAVGPELVKEIVSHLPGLCIVGIGGITEGKASKVIHAGASGVAVISAIAKAENTEEATRNIKGRVTLALTGVEM
ncbi:thiamine phosphate synthase [Sporosarcina jiandibaonis]|uniref:thiamine phosphate synthase n=1 Tax=Sporosarcina jiandibaonis TaxID=2715535 RepID=UPI0015518BAF|nr:thiamine phosphate synthase [Sporosarcina jiandibaonis]